MKYRKLILLCILLAVSNASAETVIQVDSSIHYQTMHGWSATSQSGEFQENFSLYRDVLFNRAINELGIDRLHVGIRSYTENPIDFFDPTVSEEPKHEIVNDNRDPFVINWSGFQFSSLDDRMTRVVLPFGKKLEATGERLFLVLTYVDFGPSKFKHRFRPEEYAEFVLAYYLHMQQKFHRVPDAWEIILEPDNAHWTPRQIANCVLAAAKRLESNHFTPRFILPSASNMTTSLKMFSAIAEVPGVLPYVYELSYHRYAGVSAKSLHDISSEAAKANVSTAMLEHIGSGYEDLHKDLKIGNVSSWEQYSLAFPGTNDPGGKYYLINTTDPLHPKLIPGQRTNFLRQYFHYIRMGAVRIEATTTDENFDPVAFLNRNGKWVVVIKASHAGSFVVRGLPNGIYGITFTTSEKTFATLNDVTTKGANVSAAIPAQGVITIYQKK